MLTDLNQVFQFNRQELRCTCKPQIFLKPFSALPTCYDKISKFLIKIEKICYPPTSK